MPRTVAILLFDEIETLDFAGPFEVFGVAQTAASEPLFSVHTVAETTAPVRARNGLVVTPTHSFATAPAADIVIIPGGYGTRPLLNRPEVVAWIRQVTANTEVVASVCTGALLLAKAGLLAGKPATSHYLTFDLLRQLEPTALVREDVRFTDCVDASGRSRLLTAAGVSAGLDLSLHIVAQLHGVEIAHQTARYMEYHWANDGGAKR